MNRILFPMKSKFAIDVAKLIENKNNKIYFYGLQKDSEGINEFYSINKVLNQVYYKKKKYKSTNRFKIKNLKKYNYFKNLFEATTNRVFIDDNIKKKKDLFYEICSYHYDFIKKNKITHIVYWATPHFHFGIALFCVAELLNLKQFIFFETGIQNTFLIRKNWYSSHKYKINKDNQNIIYKYLEKNFISKKAKKARSLQFDDIYGKSFFLIRFLFFVIKKILRIILIKNNNDKDGYFIYLENHSRFKEAFLRTKMLIWKLFNYTYYNYYISKKKVDLKKDYIYFALHQSPERTTMPEGGIFFDQISAIKLLRKSVPKNIKIYVKEHPNQFWLKDSTIETLYFKGIKFYKELKNINNLELLSNKIRSDEIIKNAICTATITGTSGWESIKAGKKAIVFGYPWYSSHKDCLSIVNDNIQSQNKIYSFIFKKNKTSKNYMKTFAIYLNKYLAEAQTWSLVKAPKNIKLVKEIFAKKLIRIF